uniref:Uncharacterized protein n=1 Tax=Timema shepardi TaxID=629360 RepID=A0A7R9B2S5_TIMSH|nr:unnamed protein product [Timema shepardi]
MWANTGGAFLRGPIRGRARDTGLHLSSRSPGGGKRSVETGPRSVPRRSRASTDHHTTSTLAVELNTTSALANYATEAGHAAPTEDSRTLFRVLTGKPNGWEDGIRINVKEIGCNEVDWIELAQDKDRLTILFALLIVVNIGDSETTTEDYEPSTEYKDVNFAHIGDILSLKFRTADNFGISLLG